MVLLKTDRAHLRGVIEHSIHASDGRPTELVAGGICLIEVTGSSSPTVGPRVEYAMRYIGSYADVKDKTDEIWGHHWNYLIVGDQVQRLRKSFDIRRVQVTDRNYGQGAIRFVYLDERDADAVRRARLLPESLAT